MKAVFHIGRPKTGSTTLQVFLAENRAELARRGVLYNRVEERISSQWEFPIAALAERETLPPDPYLRRVLNIHDLDALGAYSARMMAAFEAQLAAVGDGADLWVASSEHVYPYLKRPEQIEAFDQIMHRYFDDVTYVVYLRRQEDLIVSAYSEVVRRGEWPSFDAFVEKFLNSGRGNHMAQLRKWVKVVGRERIVVRLLERNALAGGDLVQDFCEVLGISGEGLAQPHSHNTSLNQKTLKSALRINRFFAVNRKHSRLREKLRLECIKLAEKLAPDGAPLALPESVAARVARECADSNERLRAMFFPDRETLFAPRGKPAPAQDQGAPMARLTERQAD